MNILWFLLIGGVAGWLAGLVMKGGGFGIIGNVIVGVIGGVLGGWLFGLLGIGAGSFVTAFVGAIVLLAIAGMVNKKK